MKLHKWSIKEKGIIEILESFKDGFSLTMKVGNVKKCEHCGLRRGTIKVNYYSCHTTVYFDERNKLLSRDRLPFKCIGKQWDFYLTKEDFYV